MSAMGSVGTLTAQCVRQQRRIRGTPSCQDCYWEIAQGAVVLLSPSPFLAATAWESTKTLPGWLRKAECFTWALFSPGEEEDGDEDEEAEAATGKRAAEDDEVGLVWLDAVRGLGSEALKLEGLMGLE